MTKQIHVNVGYGALSDKDVATQGVAVVDGMTNNPKLVNPPVNPADLKTQIETYASLIAAAADGSKKAITARKKQRAVVVKMLRQLGHWVEANCNDDAATLQSSGFQQKAPSVRNTPPQPLVGPPSFKVENGPISGQVVLRGQAGFQGCELHGALRAAGLRREAGHVDGDVSGHDPSFHHRE